jgi:hypothetical protein
MLVKQVSVFLENKSGRLAEVTRVLGEAGIDISALSIADTTEFGILRLIVNNPDRAVGVLKDSGFSVGTTEVIAISVDDQPGGLARALSILEKNGIGIEYMYAFLGSARTGKAIVIIRVEESARAIEALSASDVDIMPSADIYRL